MDMGAKFDDVLKHDKLLQIVTVEALFCCGIHVAVVAIVISAGRSGGPS